VAVSAVGWAALLPLMTAAMLLLDLGLLSGIAAMFVRLIRR
jgi:hypothetical protein